MKSGRELIRRTAPGDRLIELSVQVPGNDVLARARASLDTSPVTDIFLARDWIALSAVSHRSEPTESRMIDRGHQGHQGFSGHAPGIEAKAELPGRGETW
jgi:hypothetical protein